MGQRQRHAIAIRCLCDARADRQDRPLVVQHDIDDPCDGAADPEIGGALPGNDGIGRAANLLVDPPAIRLRQRRAVEAGKVVEL